MNEKSPGLNSAKSPGPDPARRPRRRLAWLALVAVVAACFAWVFVPVWLIQPFKAQTARGLELSYALRSWSPVVTVAAALIALALAAYLWRGGRWWSKAATVALLVPVAACSWFARQHHFEWMFRPLASVSHARAAEVDFVRDDEMVLAVELNGDAVAYPVRQAAYHHIIEDTVGGVPVAATY